ncbi:unnamed protein product, partial [Aphanomyces euteiches]
LLVHQKKGKVRRRLLPPTLKIANSTPTKSPSSPTQASPTSATKMVPTTPKTPPCPNKPLHPTKRAILRCAELSSISPIPLVLRHAKYHPKKNKNKPRKNPMPTYSRATKTMHPRNESRLSSTAPSRSTSANSSTSRAKKMPTRKTCLRPSRRRPQSKSRRPPQRCGSRRMEPSTT